MVFGSIKKVLGLDPMERKLKRLYKVVEKVNAFEPKISGLSDEDLARKTAEFKGRIENGEALEDILPEAFAVVREAARRTIGMRHFDVQVMGAVVLHEGNIAEMKTGEGKTLVATMPLYLNALLGKGAHLVTVNDYLAKRDAEWMGPVYRFLGLSVGVITADMEPYQRKEAYACDITYGTNNEFGFDYLRDNMALSVDDMVQRGHFYAIVDEVDSILIDEARTPLIISGPSEESTDIYYRVNRMVSLMKKDVDFKVDEKERNIILTEEGVAKAEKFFGVKSLYEDVSIELIRHVIQTLRAHYLYKRDVDYIVKDGKVIIVDEFTGRLMYGRRYSDGLHQAIEAKEGVKIEKENQTLATITFQNYFRMYRKLAGMTGTAATEAEEFNEIYNLDVYVIPTHKPMIRIDHPDVIYRTKKEKFNALVEEIVDLHQKGRPVLVGTSSIEKSELISKMLKRRKIPHQVLNAKYHEKEAEIIAQAGRLGAVTIATNMAGRGTDILLGGNPEFLAKSTLRRKGKKIEEVSEEEWRSALEEAKRITGEEHMKVVELGGLHIIGAQRHESRRIDNQLRGRAGRQGDPGSSRFYLSLEDDLLRLFGSDRISGLMEKLGMKEGDSIEHPWISKAIENAQKKVEEMHFEARKYLLAYDNVMNSQREVIYTERRTILQSEDLFEHILEIASDVIYNMLELYVNPQLRHDEWNIDGLFARVEDVFPFSPPFGKEEVENYTMDELHDMLFNVAKEFYTQKRQRMGVEISREIEKMVMLQIVDMKWKDHLHAMDDLRQGIGLRAYAQKDPLVEYQIEAYNMFEEMVGNIKEDTVRYLFHIELVERQPRPTNVYFPDHMPSASHRTSHKSRKKKRKARRR